MNLKTPNAIATVNPNDKTSEAPRFKYNSCAYRIRNRLMFPTEAAGFDGLVLTFAQDDRGVESNEKLAEFYTPSCRTRYVCHGFGK